MSLAVSKRISRAATIHDALIVHALYQATPKYFDIISIPIPSRQEVVKELEVAGADIRRHTELILTDQHLDIIDPISHKGVVGYLDYTLDYPEQGDATVNLLLITEAFQSQCHGRETVCYLEQSLRAKGQTKRILASIYGDNERAKAFWTSLGYQFAIDAKPLLEWYAKELRVG